MSSTLSRSTIFLAIDPLSELSFLGRLSSIVLTPYKLPKTTSSGSSSGCSWNCERSESIYRLFVSISRAIYRYSSNRHTLGDCAANAGLVILALRGIESGRDLESQLNVLEQAAQVYVRDICGTSAQWTRASSAILQAWERLRMNLGSFGMGPNRPKRVGGQELFEFKLPLDQNHR